MYSMLCATSGRTRTWTLARTLDEIKNGAGTLFDPELANELVLASRAR